MRFRRKKHKSRDRIPAVTPRGSPPPMPQAVKRLSRGDQTKRQAKLVAMLRDRFGFGRISYDEVKACAVSVGYSETTYASDIVRTLVTRHGFENTDQRGIQRQ